MGNENKVLVREARPALGAAAAASGRISADRAVGECNIVFCIDAATVIVRRIPADRAIGERDIVVCVNAATISARGISTDDTVP